MSAKSATIAVDATLAEAYNSAPRKYQKEAISAMRRTLRVLAKNQTRLPRLSKKETELFLRINRTLPPKAQSRYEELRAKRENETLTASEHAELLEFVDGIETIWADRLEALIELARLRHVSPQQLLKQLEIEARPDAS